MDFAGTGFFFLKETNLHFFGSVKFYSRLFPEKSRKISQNLPSAAVVIATSWVKKWR